LQPRNPAVAVGFYSVLSKLILTRKWRTAFSTPPMICQL
jgi:hypothetical protein